MSSGGAIESCDVIVLGAGLAGSCVARHLALTYPQLKIVQIDKKTEFDYWVGESTVDTWYYYAAYELGLDQYLEKHAIEKHGFRFFFDSAAKDLPIDELSEIGRSQRGLGLASMQLDRAEFDRDMVEMNTKLGIDVRLGVAVKSIDIDGDNGHRLATSAGDIRCRYLIDSSGRQSMIARSHGNVQLDDPRHPCGSYWVRVTNYNNIDHLGSDEWRKRVNYTWRMNSTNHFNYDGYWYWMIPIQEDVISLGISFNREMHPLKMKDADDFFAFTRQHKCLDQILGANPKALDFVGLKQLTRRCDTIYSKDRWFLVGMSGAFVDPFLSMTCIQIAKSSRFVVDLIGLDLEGRTDLFERRCVGYSYETLQDWEQNITNFDGFRRFASYDGFWAWYRLNNTGYHCRVVPAFVNWKRPEPGAYSWDAWDPREGPPLDFRTYFDVATGRFPHFVRLFREFYDLLEEHDALYRHNSGEFQVPPPFGALAHRWWDVPEQEATQIFEDTYRDTVRYMLRRLTAAAKVAFDESMVDWFVDKNALIEEGALKQALARASAGKSVGHAALVGSEG